MEHEQIKVKKGPHASQRTDVKSGPVQLNTNTHQSPLIQHYRNIGNQAVQQMMESGAIQAKLTIGQPNDKYEQEADRVADQVMRMPDSAIQRQSTCPECMEEEELIQTKQTHNQTPTIAPNIETGINSLKGGGQPLSQSTRTFFEPRFGHNFSQVRIHNDSQANETANLVNAKAFTTGKHVVFGTGQYSPETLLGKRLIAHELGHVIQQKNNDVQILMRTCNCNALQNGRNPDTSERRQLLVDYPRLGEDSYCIVGEGHYLFNNSETQRQLANFNCYAWAANLQINLRDVGDFRDYMQRENVSDVEINGIVGRAQRRDLLSFRMLDRFYRHHNFVPHEGHYPLADIIVYSRDSQPQHAARRVSFMCGSDFMYESKLGAEIRIVHRAEDIEGDTYGRITRSYLSGDTRPLNTIPRRAPYPSMVPSSDPRLSQSE